MTELVGSRCSKRSCLKKIRWELIGDHQPLASPHRRKEKRSEKERKGGEGRGQEGETKRKRSKRSSLMPSLVSPSPQEAKAGQLQVQGLIGLHSECKASLGNLVRSSQAINKRVG